MKRLKVAISNARLPRKLAINPQRRFEIAQINTNGINNATIWGFIVANANKKPANESCWDRRAKKARLMKSATKTAGLPLITGRSP